MTNSDDKIFLGIDTGGTYTDAVLLSASDGVMDKAKSITTRHDLSVGISGAVDAVLKSGVAKAEDISLVSISTTLATNALVEGKGGSIALIMIGFDQADVEKAGLKESLGNDPVIFIAGGHDVHGKETPLDMDALIPFVEEVKTKVSGFAVAGYFAVRNTSHETRVRDYLLENTELAVTCSHELSSKLGGPKRALTTVLNARLIPVIRDLVIACRKHLQTVGIDAPLMVVRGDGTLVDADFALKRPIETILSGPAASLIGARFLLGTKDAIVSDIGGTTTDVAILEKGWPRIEPNGASVGGYVTMVEAVAMHTFGLGGDSAVAICDDNKTLINLGPRRQIPISLLAQQFPEIIYRELKRQEKIEYPTPTCASFAMLSSSQITGVESLKPTEVKLFEKLTSEPQPLDTFLRGASDTNTLKTLVSKGMASVSGFTPSDAMHVLGLQDNWDGEAAKLAASIMCRMRDKFGKAIALSSQILCQNIKQQLTIQSADVILQTCMSENDIQIGVGANKLIERSLNREQGFVKFSLELDRPLVGLGASANCYYPDIGERLSSECVIPEHADVANAIGAVTSKVRVSKNIMISSTDGGSSFQIMTLTRPETFSNEEEALERAEAILTDEITQMAIDAGAQDPVFEKDINVQAADIEGKRHFVDAVITITATGEPNIQ